MDIAGAEKAIEKALSRLASPLHPNLLSDLASSILSTPYVTAVDFLLYNEVVNLKKNDFHPVVSAVFQTKKRTNRMRPSAYLREVNTTSLLKPSVRQLASEGKFTKQECGGTHDYCFVFFSSFHLARIKYFVFLIYMHQHATMGLYYFIHR